MTTTTTQALGPTSIEDRLLKQRWRTGLILIRQQIGEVATAVGRRVTVLVVSMDPWIAGRIAADGAVRVAHDHAHVETRRERGPVFSLPDESLDIAVLIGTEPDHWGTKRLLRESYRCLQVGGRLVVLRDFVPEHSDSAGTSRRPFSAFLEQLQDAAGGALAMEGLESFSVGPDPVHRAAVASFSRIGVPKTW